MIIGFESDGQIRKIDIPFHPFERTFNDFCDFKTHEYHFLRSDDIEQQEEHLRKALSKVIKGDGLYKLPFGLESVDIESMIESNYTYELGDELNLLVLYFHFFNMVQSFVPEQIPETFRFTHKGKRFLVEKAPSARVLLNKHLLTGEAIECQELIRIASEVEKIDPLPLDYGNIEFDVGLKMFSILVKQKNEKLPSKRDARNRFKNVRAEFFRTLDLQTVLELRFFFISALLNYKQTPISNFFGKVLPFLPPKNKAHDVVKQAMEEGWKKSGWRIFMMTAIENRWFEETHKTPYESVFYSDFSDFLSMLSIKNAIIK